MIYQHLKELKENEYVDENGDFILIQLKKSDQSIQNQRRKTLEIKVGETKLVLNIVKNLQIRMCDILHEFEITLAGRTVLL